MKNTSFFLLHHPLCLSLWVKVLSEYSCSLVAVVKAEGRVIIHSNVVKPGYKIKKSFIPCVICRMKATVVSTSVCVTVANMEISGNKPKKLNNLPFRACTVCVQQSITIRFLNITISFFLKFQLYSQKIEFFFLNDDIFLKKNKLLPFTQNILT